MCSLAFQNNYLLALLVARQSDATQPRKGTEADQVQNFLLTSTNIIMTLHSKIK